MQCPICHNPQTPEDTEVLDDDSWLCLCPACSTRFVAYHVGYDPITQHWLFQYEVISEGSYKASQDATD